MEGNGLSQPWRCEGNKGCMGQIKGVARKATTKRETMVSNKYNYYVTCYTPISCKCHLCVVLPKYILETKGINPYLE